MQSTPSSRTYEFVGVRLYPDDCLFVRQSDGREYSFRPKERDLLVALLKRPGQLVTYEQLRSEAWPEIESTNAAKARIRETKRTLQSLLNVIIKCETQIIETVTGQWYRLNVDVALIGNVESYVSHSHLEYDNGHVPNKASEGLESYNHDEISCASDQQSNEMTEEIGTNKLSDRTVAVLTTITELSEAEQLKTPTLTGRLEQTFAGHWRHVLFASSAYGLMYSITLLLEIAYRWDRYGTTAMELCPAVFFWIASTSMIALNLRGKTSRSRNRTSLAVSIVLFLVAAGLVSMTLLLFLPDIPVTEASFQSSTGQAAYLKNVFFYFLPLAILFLVIPFHLVLRLREDMRVGNHRQVMDFLSRRPRSLSPEHAIYISPRTLGTILFGAAITSMILTYRLFDNLKPGPYMNSFAVLAIVRVVLYFGFAVECLIWYYLTLEKIKRGCRE